MKYLFEYNWQVRNEWFELCKTLPREELYKQRIGGVRSIAYTFFHIINAEHNWLSDLQNTPTVNRDFENYQDFENIIQLSNDLHQDIRPFVENWSEEMEFKILDLNWGNDNFIHVTYGEAMRHVIAHEIHHIGQLSIWAREIGLKPISANLIHRGLFIDNKR